MKKKLILIFLVFGSLRSDASVKCYIKIGFSDCINCYNVLSVVKDFDKEYIFKNEYKGLENEILKEYLGVDGNITFHTSDSFYNAFGYEDFTVVSFVNNGKVLLKCSLSEIGKNSNAINKLKSIQPIETKINLEGIWHESCLIKLNNSEEIIILDPLLNKLKKLDSKGKILNTLSSSTKLTEEIYKAKFGEKNDELKKLAEISKLINFNSVAINFNRFALYGNSIFLLTTGHYFILGKPDTIYNSFMSIIKIDQNFDFKIININKEIKKDYFLSSTVFQIINDTTALFDLISIDTLNKPFILAECVLKSKELELKRIYQDTIPDKLVDKQLNYRVTELHYDNGYVTYSMFNGIYFKSQALPNSKLFENYNFRKEFPELKNLMTGIKKRNGLLYISYKLDSFHYVANYNLKENKMQPSFFKVPTDNLSSFLQIDLPGIIYYVNRQKILIKYKYD